MKKVLKTILFCFVIISLSACGIDEINTDIQINKVSELIGTWTSVSKAYNNKLAESRKYQFNEDGTCIFTHIYTIKGVKFNNKKEGKCFLNRSKDQFRMQIETGLPGNWETFKMEENKIIVGSFTYEKSYE